VNCAANGDMEEAIRELVSSIEDLADIVGQIQEAVECLEVDMRSLRTDLDAE